jgi:hypothetical protein
MRLLITTSADRQGAMIAASLSVFPEGYRIISIEVIVPMAVVAASHLLWPFALNPWFLSFSVSDVEF